MELAAIIISIIALGVGITALVNSRPIKQILNAFPSDPISYKISEQKNTSTDWKKVDELTKKTWPQILDSLRIMGLESYEINGDVIWDHPNCKEILVERGQSLTITNLPANKTYNKTELCNIIDVMDFLNFIEESDGKTN